MVRGIKKMFKIIKIIIPPPQHTSYKYKLIKNEISFKDLEQQLIDLYRVPYSDIRFIKIYDQIMNEDIYKLFIYSLNTLKHILLFKNINKNELHFLNSLINFTSEDIDAISNIIFYVFPNVKNIYFNRIFFEKNEKYNRYSFYETSNDMVLELPDSFEKYLGLLGSQTRKHLSYYQRRIKIDKSDFRLEFISDKNISFDIIHKIIELNRLRMISKGGVSGIDDISCNNIYRYAKLTGLLCICYIKDKIIGGTINYILNDNAFLHVIAHDNIYNKYNIGQIALITTIQYLIENNIAKYHMLWGETEYKYRFLCKKNILYNVTVFRKPRELYFAKMKMILRKMTDIQSNIRKLKSKMKAYKIIRFVYYNIKSFIKNYK
jgi:hypothetical protein